MAQTKNTLNLTYSLVRNTLPGTSGFHRSVTHVGGRDGQTVFGGVAAKLPGQTEAGAELVWNSMAETIMEYLVQHQYRVVVNGFTFELAIPGSTVSVNGAPSESAYVAIRSPDSFRNAAAEIRPVSSAGAEADKPRLDSVESLSARGVGTIAGAEPFRLAGSNISASGEGESVVVTAADGTDSAAVVEREDGLGTSITLRLSAALPPGKGKVVLTTHGKRTPEGELRPLAKSVTILAGDTPEPTPPEPIWESTDGLVKVMSVSDSETGDTFTWGNAWNMLGEGFTGTEPGWFVEIAMLSTAPGANPVNLDFNVKSATEVELTPGAGAELDAGEYPNASITFGIAHESEEGLDTETAEIPVRLVVSD